MSILNDLHGKKVIIYSEGGSGEKQDVGVLEADDNNFIKIKKSDTEYLYFGIARIRMIKPFDF